MNIKRDFNECLHLYVEKHFVFSLGYEEMTLILRDNFPSCKTSTLNNKGLTKRRQRTSISSTQSFTNLYCTNILLESSNYVEQAVAQPTNFDSCIYFSHLF